MKKFLLILAAFCFSISASAQSGKLATDLQAADAAHWPAINALLIAQRDELTASNLATLSSAAADFKSKLEAANTERDAALAKFSALQDQVSTVLNAQLSALAPQLTVAQSDLAAELKTGDGPQAAAKRLIVADLQARIETLNALIVEAGKSDKQKAVEAAQAAKDAADKALSDAQDALNK